ncbi:MAG: NRDE family protein [Halobacteriaceae archaeon]
MCTFVLAWRVFDDAVVVAANRDECTDRASEPPGVFARDPRVVAPRDAEAGGTWLGYNEHGVLAAVTNRWTDTDLAGERSRGLLVGDALARASASEAAAAVEASVADREYAGFNLVAADADDACLLEWDGTLQKRAFDPGVHVVVNVGADDEFAVPESRREAGRRQVAGARRAREELAPSDGETAGEWLDRAAGVLADHDYGFCVHGDGFGTRSSSLVAVGDDPTYRFADGPPCSSAYRTIDGV